MGDEYEEVEFVCGGCGHYFCDEFDEEVWGPVDDKERAPAMATCPECGDEATEDGV